MQRSWIAIAGVALLAFEPGMALAQATGCAAGTTCLGVEDNGTVVSQAPDYVAQCSGVFPDFIVPTEFLGPSTDPRWFTLSQDYPTVVPTGDAPWKTIGYTSGEPAATQFLFALRDYALDGMVDAEFRPEDNAVRKWYHMPLMNYGPRPRESRYGVTNERTLNGPEVGLKIGSRSRNYAVGFYNEAGAVTIGEVWSSPILPDLTKAHFADGTMTFKVLFADAPDSAFDGPSPLAGAPKWTIQTANGLTDVRLMQMDVAVVDPDSPTGWVFGTLAYDPTATDADPWKRLRPVGLSWGNDPGVTPADISVGQVLQETIISPAIPPYAAAHLGWAGRTNGPIDNPVSGCLSCHGTAQHPSSAGIIPPATCTTDAKKLQWFRNFDGSVPFGRIDSSCVLSPDPSLIPLDFSMQLQVSVQSILQYNDVNPCAGAQHLMEFTITQDVEAAPRVMR